MKTPLLTMPLTILKPLLRSGGYALAFVALLALAGMAYQSVGTILDQQRFPPPGRLVEVGDGHKLHISCSGEGGPTVVLDAGGADSSLVWHAVQADLALRTRTCSFDRMGFGWSDPIPRPHTSREYVSLQRTLLQNAGVEGPYILVGHSLGGLNAQLFASQHPQGVAGMVLVDSGHEEMYERLPEFAGADQPFLKGMRLASRLGIVRLALALGVIDPPQFASLSPEVRAMFQAKLARSQYWDAAYEMNTRLAESAEQVRAAGPLPEVPLVVITHGVGDLFSRLGPTTAARAEQIWQELQLDLARRSPDGQLVIAEGSGHMIPLERPERVIDGVEQVLDALEG